MALAQRVDHLGARNSTEKVDPVGDPCPAREPLQPPALRAIADHPIFGVRQPRLGEGGKTERKTAAGPQRADAEEPDRRRGRRRQACKGVARFGRDPGGAAQLDPGGAERPHPRGRIPGAREHDRAASRGQAHQRVVGRDLAPERAQPRADPTGSIEPRAKARPRRLVAVDRAPHERHRQQGQQARGRPIARAGLMGEIEADLGVQTARPQIGAQLPEIGAGRPARTLRGPPAQAMDIAELRPRQRMAADCRLDRGAIAGVGQNPDLMMPGDLLDHVPADRGPRALIGLARGHRQQNLHRCGLPLVSARGEPPPGSITPPAPAGIDRACGRSPSAVVQIVIAEQLRLVRGEARPRRGRLAGGRHPIHGRDPRGRPTIARPRPRRRPRRRLRRRPARPRSSSCRHPSVHLRPGSGRSERRRAAP